MLLPAMPIFVSSSLCRCACCDERHNSARSALQFVSQSAWPHASLASKCRCGDRGWLRPCPPPNILRYTRDDRASPENPKVTPVGPRQSGLCLPFGRSRFDPGGCRRWPGKVMRQPKLQALHRLPSALGYLQRARPLFQTYPLRRASLLLSLVFVKVLRKDSLLLKAWPRKLSNLLEALTQ